ncbi:S9 family peptidase [Pseudomonas subflava]|uniref:S9 family peptidase n=1 Tax=Pseudomonas subflava TaxID=2952933 RepID=UPI002079708D|nr:S9 family peptidase [Pseudomonas subflava]
MPNPDALWSAAQAAAAGRDFAELHAAHGGVLWVEFEPASGRCSLQFLRDDQRRELTPPGYSVRSRVYEYGGGASCATERGAAFVNDADQQIHLIDDVAASAAPRRLTERADCRYGDLVYAPAWRALLAVEECREGEAVVHRLVRIDLAGRREVLVEGADFYAAPVASADGRRLAWIEWSRPQQPWTATRLCLREAGGSNRVLAGAADDQALQQPRFDTLGRLWVLSDRDGWWQPICVDDDDARGAPRDHAAAPWQLGGRTYLPLDGELLLTRFEQGFGVLAAVREAAGERRLADDFTRFRALAADAGHYYCIAAAPDRLSAVLAVGRTDGAVRVLAGGERLLNEAHLPRPQPLDCPVGEGERCHGFFYAPYAGAERPPLVVFLHGGPTSACYPVFDPRIPFWTLRGFAVLDLNYRGSSGFGRAYRQRLQGEWGRIELDDIRAAVAHLAQAGRIDPARVFVRGASAGGYSALLALAQGGYAGGASLYGVSDPLALRRLTHKFEADYLDWLLGDPQQHAERYRQRTPLQQAGRIRVPVIFFQGGRDAVVVPQQTESMVAALRDNGIAVEYRLFPDEGHGFRLAAHQAEALEAEHAFYRDLS